MFTDISVIHALQYVSLSANTQAEEREVVLATKGGCVYVCVAGVGGATIKRQHAVSHEVLMPRISCSNVIHIPSVIQPAALMYESIGDFISNTPPPPCYHHHHFYNPTLTLPPHRPPSPLQPLLLLCLHRTSPSVSECLCWLLSRSK